MGQQISGTQDRARCAAAAADLRASLKTVSRIEAGRVKDVISQLEVMAEYGNGDCVCAFSSLPVVRDALAHHGVVMAEPPVRR